MAQEATTPSGEGMIQQIKDPLLQKIKAGIEAKVPEDMKRDYLAIIVAGMKIMFSPETHQIAVRALTEAAQSRSLPHAVALGTVTLMNMIYQESKGQMSIPASFPAAVVLMLYAFEFVEKMQPITITPQMIADATKVVTLGLMKLFGITQEKLAEGLDYARQQQGAAPPAAAEEMPAEAAPVPNAGV